VGILGCGLDIVYPRCNRDLFRKMEQQGCLISEYPPGTKPNRWQFPERNRIISGISCGVLVVEAPEKSGALITARQALEQGRDVYAVPGNIGVDSCLGSNALLRDGAGVVMSGWDILENYAHRYPDKIRKDIPKTAPFPEKIAVDNPVTPIYSDVDKKADGPDAVERMLLSALGTEEALIDTLIAKTGLPSAEVLAALTMLEVQGMVTTRPGGWVSAS
jgi:DNA processing protein